MVQHIALIMDGNRRWARKRLLQPWLGHKEGIDSVKRSIEFCLENKIRFLSLYLFSLENFNRTQRERGLLFNLLISTIKENTLDLKNKGVKIKFVGDRNFFPADVISHCDFMEEETKNCNDLHLNLLFCYGGRQEIVSGVREVIDQILSGKIKKDDITVDNFQDFLWLNNTPCPDIVIRTGGHFRLSNFLLYQTAYSELFFLDKLWPDINKDDLSNIYIDFKKRKRNFGV